MRAEDVRVILLDFHAEATSEKIAMGRALDGRVSLVVGTHTHVQTADEQIFPRGTAYLTDAGMCGPAESVLGREIASVVWRFRSGLPTRFPVAKGPVRICGVIVGVDEDSGHAVELKRVDELFSPANQSVEMAESEAEMEQGIPGRHEPPEDALAASAPLPCSISASDSAISTLWFAGLNNSSTRFNSTA
jgi:hypothetical protein